jgi:hypothetical protein
MRSTILACSKKQICKLGFIIALTGGAWLSCSIRSYAGGVTIDPPPGGDHPICYGSENITGEDLCETWEGHGFDLSVVNSLNPGAVYHPLVSYGDSYGDWGVGVQLELGVNVITASDCSDYAIQLISNGGSGPAIYVTEVGVYNCNKVLGLKTSINVCCLPADQSGYDIREDVTWSGTCPCGDQGFSNGHDNYGSTGDDGCMSTMDTNVCALPGSGPAPNDPDQNGTYANCQETVTQTLSVTGPNGIAAVTDNGSVVYGASSGTLTVSGTAVTTAPYTQTCP